MFTWPRGHAHMSEFKLPTARTSGFEIRNVGIKILVVGVWAIVGFLVVPIFRGAGGALAGDIAVCAWNLLFVVGGTRTFRGANEPSGPREWWRMTARPIAGFIIGGLILLSVAISDISLLLVALKTGGAPVVGAIVVMVVDLVVAAAYFSSSARLTARK